MLRPGPRNLITDVEGILVGNAEDERARSGVTVVLPAEPAVAAVDVRGGGPGTRETEALHPASLVPGVDAVVLSGGSAFGLDAASGVMQWLAAADRGFLVAGFRVPIVPAAILFDLANGGDKRWGREPPYRRLGEAAVAQAAADFALGNAGAGLGASAGRIKGGLGSVSAVGDDGWQIGALIAANPAGSVLVPGTKTLWGAPFEQAGELGGAGALPGEAPVDLDLPPEGRIGGHTCIGVVATNLALGKADALRVAIMAHDGLARAVRPVHTPMDGDTLFVLSTARLPLPEPKPLALARLGHIAADCVTRALARGVYAAEGLGDRPGYRSLAAGI
ncbi:MAG TPA: P1 family peptidase [Candidatus Sulfotelmatobacter sp.]|nr:P1 family peptidase [Candidatus Sulfotelmatobacter sp.]